MVAGEEDEDEDKDEVDTALTALFPVPDRDIVWREDKPTNGGAVVGLAAGGGGMGGCKCVLSVF